jgi:hypothetical protein
MTREQAEKLLPMVQAVADGKSLEFEESPGCWSDRPDPHFNSFNYNRWRVKADPWEGQICVHPDGTACAAINRSSAPMVADGWRRITVREIPAPPKPLDTAAAADTTTPP